MVGRTAVGNITLAPRDQGMNAEVNFRNSVLGLGRNAGLVTQAVISTEPIEGIAYRCPSGGTAGAK